MEHLRGVTEQMGEASEASNPYKPASPSPRDAKLLESIHLEESLFPEQAQQLNGLVLEFCDVFAIDQSELGTTDMVTHVIDTGFCPNQAASIAHSICLAGKSRPAR